MISFFPNLCVYRFVPLEILKQHSFSFLITKNVKQLILVPMLSLATDLSGCFGTTLTGSRIIRYTMATCSNLSDYCTSKVFQSGKYLLLIVGDIWIVNFRMEIQAKKPHHPVTLDRHLQMGNQLQRRTLLRFDLTKDYHLNFRRLSQNWTWWSEKSTNFYWLTLNSLTPKIWLAILPFTCFTFPCKLVTRIWHWIKMTTSTWLV